MNKKVLAVAVAGALALPGVALAQSSVTISGVFKGGFESLKYNDAVAGKSPASQTGIVDDSSRIIFNVREDLGGGLAAIGQIDMRFGLDTGALAATGNTWVGLQSSQWGRVFVGRQDLHYFGRESNLTVRGSLRADSISILAYSAGGGSTVAPATRSANVVHYTTPNWGGFSAVVAYSANPFGVENDIGNGGIRKGSAWNIAPVYQGSNFTVGYSYWSAKPDAQARLIAYPGVVTPPIDKTRGDRLFGSYRWSGLSVGLAWDSSKWTAAAGAGDAKRTAWSIPIEYSWGPHNIMFHYDKAKSDKGNAFAGAETGARMLALSYGYDLSKRTSAAITYAQIKNDRDAVYNFFTSNALGIGAQAGSAPAAAIAPGEDPRMWGVTLRHAF